MEQCTQYKSKINTLYRKIINKLNLTVKESNEHPSIGTHKLFYILIIISNLIFIFYNLNFPNGYKFVEVIIVPYLLVSFIGYFILFSDKSIKISDKKYFVYAIIIFLIIISIVLNWVGTLPSVGYGNDNAVALQLWIVNLLHHTYPYYGLTQLNNPITPLPFLTLYSIPYYFLGNVSYQNIVNVILIITIIMNAATTRKELNFGIVSLFLSVPLYVYLVNRTDNLTVAAFTLLALYLLYKSRLKIASILFGFLIATKGYFLVVIPAALYYIQAKAGYKKMIYFIITSGIIAAVLILPFVLWNPHYFFNNAPLGMESSLITHALGLPLAIIALAIIILISLISFKNSMNIFIGVISALIFASILITDAFFTRTIFLTILLLIIIGITLKSSDIGLKRIISK